MKLIEKFQLNGEDKILDPLCGSGTTLVAAVSMKRRAIGIDTSDDALNITLERLKNPIKTESMLLQKGRASYKQAEEEILLLLRGLEFAPVQRNKGIDAILGSDVDGNPILVRIQRDYETILDAAQSLYRASKGKNAAALFVVAIREGGYFEFSNQLPPRIKIINAPAIEIKDMVSQLKNSIAV